MKTVAGTTVQGADVAQLRLGRASMDAVRTTVWLLILITISRVHQHFLFLGNQRSDEAPGGGMEARKVPFK